MFDRIFAPITSFEFVNEFFNRRPLHIPGDSKSFDDLLDIDSFYRCLKNCENVRAVFPGMKQARIAPDDAPDMYDAGATICATGMDLARQPLGDLTRELRDDLQYLGLVTANAYLSPPSTGFDHHFDPRIVTTLQISGQKTWKYCETPFEMSPTKRSYGTQAREEALREHVERHGTQTALLEPGDVLCLPAGCIHWAQASDSSPSLATNIAFDYIDYGIADFVTRFIRRRLLEQPELRRSPFSRLDTEALALIQNASELVNKMADEIRSRPHLVLQQPDE